MRFFNAMNLYGITLGYQMSGGYIWPNVSMTRNLTKSQPDPKPDLWEDGYMWCLLFLYTFESLEADIALHIVIFYIFFCLGMLGIDCGWSDMAWQMSPTPREDISLKCSENIFVVHFILNSPLKFFQHNQWFRDWDPSEMYISLSFLYKCETFRGLSLFMLIFFTYLLSGNFWGGCFTC